MINTKVCYKCKQEKPFSEYHKNKLRKTGYCAECKSCRKEIMKKYYSNPLIRASILEQKKVYIKDPIVKDRMREYQKEYRLDPINKERKKQYYKRKEND